MKNLFSYLFYVILICSVTKYVETLKSENIVGGDLAAPGAFKYHATLIYGTRRCSGGIISASHIVTTAHCLVDDSYAFLPGPMYIIAGTNEINSTNPFKIESAIEKVYIPTDFIVKKSQWMAYNIAVVKLQYPLNLHHSGLGVLSLPDKSRHYANLTAIVTGVGIDDIELEDYPNSHKFKSRLTSNKLRYAKATVYHSFECLFIFPEATYSQHLCARLIQRSAWFPEGVCFGDSGAPLVVDGHILIGTLITGPESCDETFFPAVYNRVSEYLPFIYNAINDKCKLLNIICHELPYVNPKN